MSNETKTIDELLYSCDLSTFQQQKVKEAFKEFLRQIDIPPIKRWGTARAIILVELGEECQT